MATKPVPIKERTFYSKASSSGPPFSPPYERPTKYKHYSMECLELACKSVRDGMSLRQAEEEYKIPKSTIQDHISGKVALGSSSRQRYLTDQEEKELVKFLIESAKVGYPCTRKQVLSLVQRVLEEKGRGNLEAPVSSGWWEGFKKRHPEVVLRAAESLSLVRATSCTQEALANYLNLLEQTLNDNGLLSYPA